MKRTEAIERLLLFAKSYGLMQPADERFCRNALLRAMRMDAPDEARPVPDGALPQTATEMLTVLTDDAVLRGVAEDGRESREAFSAHLMNLLTPPPSACAERFETIRRTRGVRAATDWLYALCRASDYIRVDQIARNIAFGAPSPYGRLEITINLSKPEKDPRDIARQLSAPKTNYPQCMLCVENEGYAGRPGYPTHETLRMLPVTLSGESWHFQYSPYAYYTEHCIALNDKHIPMSITRQTFAKLLDFLDAFPHYFIGSNADLPIVGGSILSHDHFQGGRHLFPMDRAPAYAQFVSAGHPAVSVEAVRWPMTCIRLVSADREQLTDLSAQLLAAWRVYDDPAVAVLHETNGTPHNTITPIARRTEDGRYTLQLVLRNNRTTAEHPLGLFHPHADLHHIKRENIGLIEVMGLFVLPGRLRAELGALQEVLTGKRSLESVRADAALRPHADWISELAARHGTALHAADAHILLQHAVGEKCMRVLEDACVFKPDATGDEALARFLCTAGLPLLEVAPAAV